LEGGGLHLGWWGKTVRKLVGHQSPGAWGGPTKSTIVGQENEKGNLRAGGSAPSTAKHQGSAFRKTEAKRRRKFKNRMQNAKKKVPTQKRKPKKDPSEAKLTRRKNDRVENPRNGQGKGGAGGRIIQKEIQ